MAPDTLGSEADRATFQTLHTASLASPPLRAGLTRDGPALGPATAHLLGHRRWPDRPKQVLAWDGVGDHHRAEIMAARGPAGDRPQARRSPGSSCDAPDCPLRWAVVAPFTVDDRVHGALVACAPRERPAWSGPPKRSPAGSPDNSSWRSSTSRTRLIEAEIRALRAQISPHFIFNSLAAIASFVRTDPDAPA